MRDYLACPQELGVEIAAIASAAPEHPLDQEATGDIVLAMAPDYAAMRVYS